MEFKKLSDVEVVETPAESANVLIEENGIIKKAPKDEFKAKEEWDLDWELDGTYTVDDEGNDSMNFDYTINTINTFENIKNKILSGIQPKCKVRVTSTGWGNTDSSLKFTEFFNSMYVAYAPAYKGDPEHIVFAVWGSFMGPFLHLGADGSILSVGDDG